MVPSPMRWMWGLQPLLVDSLFAVSLAAIDVALLVASHNHSPGVTEPNALAVVLLLVVSLPLIRRRRQPVLVLAVTMVGFIAYHALGFPDDPPGAATMVALYSVAAYCPRRIAVITGAIAIPVICGFSILGVLFTDQVRLVDVAPTVALVVTVWVVGTAARTKRSYTTALEERAVLLERERQDEGRRAVAEERSRLARELHDVVAHHVSVMVVQAGAARRVLDHPDLAREALVSIEATGSQALAEMRNLLGVLRSDDRAADALEPQPGLGQLRTLLASVREVGLPVELRVEGEARTLPAGVDLSAYRIVQEALTNTLKHARAARAQVLLRYVDGGLEVHVSDDGRSGADHQADRNGSPKGHGLIGMRERVAMFGGELRAGPRPGGGFSVTARLPAR
jgi:signal transduction histidine kinase